MSRWCITWIWNPHITDQRPNCFENRIYQLLPVGFFWILLPFWIYMLMRKEYQYTPLAISNLFLVKIVFTVLFIVAEIICAVFKRTSDLLFMEYLGSTLYVFTAMTMIWLMNFDRRHGLYSSGLLCVFWFLVFLTILPNLIDSILKWKSIGSENEIFYVFLHAFTVTGSFIVQCLVEKQTLHDSRPNQQRPLVPDSIVSFPSRIFYTWVTPLIRKGYERPLTEQDCWDLSKTELTKTVVVQVKARLDQKYLAQQRKNQVLVKEEEEDTNLILQKPINKTKVIFWRSLFRTYRDKIIFGGFLKLSHDMLQLLGPLIMKLLLNFLKDQNRPTWLGFIYAILLSIITFCQTILMRAQFHTNFLVGFRFRSAITGLVYRKSLKLTNAARQKIATGEMVNLMAIDASRFSDVTHNMHVLWTGPIQLFIVLILLYQQMGLSIIPGVIILIVMLPINSYLHRVQKRLASKQLIVKDQRIKLTNEILNGIRVLKLYAWEPAFIRSINNIREKELRYIRQKAVLNAISSCLWTFTPILVAISTFASYVLSSGEHVLTAEKAFVSLALFNLFRGPLVSFPNVFSSVVEARVSNERIQTYLNSDELDENAVTRGPLDGKAVKISDATFQWIEGGFTMKNIDLEIKKQSLLAIVGMVGSGKTSLLSAILGEIHKIHGTVIIDGTTAYVPQTAWIINDTLKENILFGKPYQKAFYDQIVEACALRKDLEMLPFGDETEIGEKGINLSGGQRQRVSLARALYSNADIYLLDDPLSAVDAHVGAHIFRQVLSNQGLLKDKTRIWVTHGVSHLSRCDQILVLDHGSIIDAGSYDVLIDRSVLLKELVRSTAESDLVEEHPLSESNQSMADTTKSTSDFPELSAPAVFKLQLDTDDQSKDNKTIKKETVQTGSVKFNVFMIYIRACRPTLILLISLLFMLTVSNLVSANVWLARWTDQLKTRASNQTAVDANQMVNMMIYASISILQGCFALAMQLVHKFASWSASQELHSMILFGVLRAPISFFDTTPLGRILNRFSKDIDSVDTSLPNSFSQSLNTLVTVIGTLIILVYGSWWVLVALVPLVFVFLWVQRIYVSTSRQLRRLDSVTRGSMYANFGETLQGLSSIRAYQVQQRFIDESDNLTDRNQACYFASSVANRWLGIRLETIANLLTLFTAVAAVVMRDRLTVGTVGLMITYSLHIISSLNMIVRMSSEIETNIVGVERIHEYSLLKAEASWTNDENEPAPRWPTDGHIEIRHLSTRYRDDLALVLNDLSIDIQPGEKIGVIGRTGSGKSSLCFVLFRMIEPTNGQIIIDKVNIAHIGLHDLRSKLTIIPQDAVIFAGTIRFNIDPFGHYSDVEIWHVLDLVHLKQRFQKTDRSLSFELSEGGQNLSAGERQLICLARALLRKSKIFILDEATAAIDMETDRLIQTTIRSSFKDATVITVAHRLNTILDSTKILVLSNGRIVEYDHPQSLANDSNSAFSKLLLDANMRMQ